MAMVTSNRSSVIIYHENWLLRKEGVKQWAEYWGVIRGKWLQFYERSDEYNRPELRKTLEITPQTKCSLVKRNKKRFPFSIDNGNGVYYMKVETELERYHWIVSILTAALGKPKRTDLPDRVPDSMAEAETFRKLSKQEKLKIKKAQPRPVRKPPIPAAEVSNKRRRRFAERCENKVKKKERKRLRNLGLDPEEYLQEREEKQNGKERQAGEDLHSEKHHRAQSMTSLRQPNNTNQSMTSLRNTTNRSQSVISLRQHNNNTKLHAADGNKHREQILGSSPNINLHKSPKKEAGNNGTVAIKAMVHPPTSSKQASNGGQSHNKSQKKEAVRKSSTSHYNRAFVGDDIVEELPTCPVVLNDDGLLPNMVFTEVSDDDDDESSEEDSSSGDEENTTEELSMNSNSGSLLNISGGTLDSLRATITSEQYLHHGGFDGTSRRGSATIVSHTIITDDGDAMQYSTAPVADQRKRPISAKRPQSGGAGRMLMERPLSPLITKPLSPFLRNSRPTTPTNNNNNKSSEDFARFLESTTTI